MGLGVLGFLLWGSIAMGKGAGALALCIQNLEASAPTWHRRQFVGPFPKNLRKGAEVPVAYFDLDGTLRASEDGTEIIQDESNIRILKNVAPRLRKIARDHLVVVVTNHAWVPKRVPEERAAFLIHYSIEMLRAEGAVVNYYDYAGADPTAAKPAIGMATTFEARLKEVFGASIDRTRSFMVGDDGYGKNTSDSGFAKNLRIPFFIAKEFFQPEPRY